MPVAPSAPARKPARQAFPPASIAQEEPRRSMRRTPSATRRAPAASASPRSARSKAARSKTEIGRGSSIEGAAPAPGAKNEMRHASARGAASRRSRGIRSKARGGMPPPQCLGPRAAWKMTVSIPAPASRAASVEPAGPAPTTATDAVIRSGIGQTGAEQPRAFCRLPADSVS